MKKQESLPRGLIWVLVLLSIASLAAIQALYDQGSSSFRKDVLRAILRNEQPLIPSVQALKFISLGDKPLMADILWLANIQIFGAGNPYGRYPAMGPMLNSITQLDPKFEYPYEFAQVVLPFENGTDSAITIGERQQKELPGNGLLTYYLASTYLLNKKDYQKAAFYFKKAADEPGSPTAARVLAGTALDKINGTLDDRLIAIDYWKNVYDTARTDAEKERAGNWFIHMQMVYQLESIALDFKSQHGRFPNNLQEMVDLKLIPGIPQPPTGRILVLDNKTGQINYDHVNPDALN